jgi:hypothetical protein
VLSEWRLTPEYVLRNWTEEKLMLMLEKRSQRVERLQRLPAGSASDDSPPNRPANLVSDSELFGRISQIGRKHSTVAAFPKGVQIKRVKKEA